MNKKEGLKVFLILSALVLFLNLVSAECYGSYTDGTGVYKTCSALTEAECTSPCVWCLPEYVGSYSSCSGYYREYIQTIPESYYTCEGEIGLCMANVDALDGGECTLQKTPETCIASPACHWEVFALSEGVTECSQLTNSADCSAYDPYCSWEPTKLNTCTGTYSSQLSPILDEPDSLPLPSTTPDTTAYPCSSFDGNETACKSHAGCTWWGYEYVPTLTSCSGFSEWECASQIGCTPVYECVSTTIPSVGGQVLKWANKDKVPYEKISPLTPFSLELDSIIYLLVQNPINPDGFFSLYEIDSFTDEDGTNDNLGDAKTDLFSSIKNELVNEINTTYTSFNFSQEVINMINDGGEGGVFEFEFWYSYDNIVNKSVILYVSPTSQAQTLNWSDVDMNFYRETSANNNLSLGLTSVVNVLVRNPINPAGVFSLYEIDEGLDGEGSTDDNLTTYLNDSIVNTLVSGVNTTFTSFTFSQELINAVTESLAEGTEGGILEFKFTYAYDGITNESTILHVSRNLESSCSDGSLNGDEVGIDCGGSCSPCLCNNNGTCEEWEDENSCPCDCVVAETKEFVWGFESLSQVADDSNFELSIRVYNPSIVNDIISLYEDDSVFDDEIAVGIEGEPHTISCEGYILGYIQYNYSLKAEDFIKANENDGTYEFYFEDGDGDKSEILTITLSSPAPYCGDGVCSVGETEFSCSADCLACTSFLVCSDYNDSASCGNDDCTVTKNNGGYCFWDTLSGACVEKVNFVLPDGTEIGSCLYSNNETGDDCSDSFLTYSWNAEWLWAPANPGQYDPENMSASCVNGTATIPCLAEVELNYFTWKNLIIAVFVILIFYILIKSRQKEKNVKSEAGKGIPKKINKKVSKVNKKLSKDVSKKKTLRKKK